MLQKIDFLGPPINLRINGDKILKTKLGGCMTIVMVIVVILSFLSYSSDMILKKNPQTTTEINLIPEHDIPKYKFKFYRYIPKYELKSSNLFISIYDQETDIPFKELDRKFLTSAQIIINNGTYPPPSSKKVYFEKCDQEEALKKATGNFLIGKENYYCLPSEMSMYNTKIHNNHSIIRIQTEYCKNNTEFNGKIINDCYDREFIEKNISNRIQMNYITEINDVNLNSYREPIKKQFQSGIVNTEANTWTRATINFRKISLSTVDTSNFITSIWNPIRHFYGFHDISIESLKSPGTEVIFSHYLGIDKFEAKYERRYRTPTDVIILVGGMVSGFKLITQFLLIYFSSTKLVNKFNMSFQFYQTNNDSKKVTSTDILSKIEMVNKSNNTKDNSKKIDTLNNFDRCNYNNDNLSCTFNNQTTNKLSNKYILKRPSNSYDLKSISDELFLQIKSRRTRRYKFEVGICHDICCKICLPKNRLNLYRFVEKKMRKVFSFENIAHISRNTRLFSHLLLRDDERFLLKKCCFYNENECGLNADQLNNLTDNCETFITHNTKKGGGPDSNNTSSYLINYILK